MDATRVGLKARYLAIGIVAVVLFGAWPTLDLIQRNLSGIALAKLVYASQCSPLSLLQCAALRPDAGAAATLDATVANHPTDSTARRDLGFYLILQKNFDGAERELRQAVAESPGDDPAAFALATLDLRAGRADVAVATWRRIGAAPFVAGYAHLAAEGRDLEGARSLFALALETKPEDRNLQSGLAAIEKVLKPTATPKAVP